jgi:RNA polymerase sigma-70 factor, ECF subfamily
MAPGSAAPLDVLLRERDRFLAFLMKRVRDKAEAEEILQAAYAKGLRRSSDIEKDESTVAWFYRLLRNSLIDHWRHRAAESKALGLYAGENKGKSAKLETDLEKAVCACVKKLVGTVKPEYAEAIEKVDLKGMTLTDFARQAGVSPNNATVRARQSLKKRLIETCGSCAEHACLDCNCKHL